MISGAIIPAVLAQAGGGGGMGGLPTFIMFGLLAAIFYFMIIRPQQKQAKAHRAMLDQLKKGDGVVTNGGFIGRISSIADKFVVVELNRDVKVRVLRGSISAKAPDGLIESAESSFEGSNTKE